MVAIFKKKCKLLKQKKAGFLVSSRRKIVAKKGRKLYWDD